VKNTNQFGRARADTTTGTQSQQMTEMCIVYVQSRGRSSNTPCIAQTTS